MNVFEEACVQPSDRPPPPDPRGAAAITDLLGGLRRLRAWAGMPTYREIAERVARQKRGAGGTDGRPAISTVADYFTKTARARLDYDLFFALVRALDPVDERASWWHEAWQGVFAREGGGGAVAGAGAGAGAMDALPEPTAGFTGRTAELAELVGSADDARTVVVSGMPGIGKTALAVHAGWELMRRGFGPVLYSDLAGFRPGLPPADSGTVLRSFLRQLAGPDGRIPPGQPARRQLFRRLLDDRPGAVVILDDAVDPAQVTALLADGPTVRVIVTSRLRLPVPGARHLRPGVLPSAESIRLLGRLTSPARVAAEPLAARAITERCGHLPLALTLVAHQVAAKPHWSLADQAARLTALGIDDGVRRALALSYRRLTDTEAVLLRRLAISPGPDFDGEAAAALLGTDVATGTTALAGLDRASLVQSQPDGRHYRVPGLVRTFARERAVDDDAASERRAVVRRLERRSADDPPRPSARRHQ